MTEPLITRAEPRTAPVSALLALVEACRAADGVTPLSEHALLHRRYGSKQLADMLKVFDRLIGSTNTTSG